jgi:hypothetical protein
MIALCKSCGIPFVQYDDGKGTPKLYCDTVCRSAAHRKRNLANREKRRQECGVSPMVEAVNTMAHEQMR